MAAVKRAVGLLFVLVGVCAFASPALADRAFATRYAESVNGDIAIVGNTLMTCQATVPNCTVVQQGGGSGAQLSNNAYAMTRVDTDGDAATTLDSSTARLSVPDGATVLFAGLYYGARTTGGTGGQAAPVPAARGTVKFRPPGVAYQTLVSPVLDDSVGITGAYAAFADVTDQVAAAGSGVYAVGDVQAATGGDRYAGWALVVAYRDPSEPARNLNVFDGLQTIEQGDDPLSLPLSGFRTPATGPVRTSVGVVAYEGDRSASGDTLALNTTLLTDAPNPIRNVFNSTIGRFGTRFEDKAPDFDNQLGFDADTLGADGILANGATSAVIGASTTLDQYVPHAFTLATELFAPRVEGAKAVANLTEPGGPHARGDTLRYSVTFANTGQDGAARVVATDRLPAGTDYVPGSLRVVSGPNAGAMTDAADGDQGELDTVDGLVRFRLGAGAGGTDGGLLAPGASTTFSFDATIASDLPAGAEIVNSASADYFGQTAGTPLSAETPPVTTVVYAPDLTVTKTHFGGIVGGLSTPFTITATNDGTLATAGAVTVTDAFPPASVASISVASAPGWDCAATAGLNLSCSRSDPLGAGRSYPPIVVSALIVPVPPTTFSNVATVAGGGDADVTDNASTDVGPTTTRVDLQLQKQASADELFSGERVEYELTLRNGGPSTATGVTVDDPLGVGWSDVTATTSQGSCTAAVVCTIGTMTPDATVTITIAATIDAAGTTLTNTATASANETDEVPGNDSASADVTVPPTADLALAKAATPNPTAGQVDDETYTITVTNTGPSDATGVVVTDPLPAGFTPTTVTASGFTCSGALTCTGGSIASGDSTTITVVGTLALATQGQIVQNSAQVTANQADPDEANNSATADALVIPAADIGLTKSGPGTVRAGELARFELAVRNLGPSDATGVVVADPLPAGLEFVSASVGCTLAGRAVTCAVGALPDGAARDRSITVRGSGSAVGTTVRNLATASADQPDPVAANNTAAAEIDVTQPPAAPPAPPPPSSPSSTADLAVTKTVSGARRIGRVLTYLVRVTNRGPATASGVRATDALVGRGMVRSVTPSQGTCTRKPLACDLGDMSAGAAATVRVRAIPLRAGTLTNTAAVTAAVADPVPGNNGARVATPIAAGRTKVTLTMKASVRSVRSGGPLRYRIRIRSRGPATAVGLRICDRVPATLVLLRAPGARERRGQACWSIGTLDPGASRSFALRVRAATTPRRVINTVTARGANVARRRARAAVRVLPAQAAPCPRAATDRPPRALTAC